LNPDQPGLPSWNLPAFLPPFENFLSGHEPTFIPVWLAPVVVTSQDFSPAQRCAKSES
jgi:hypothetical protein